jgi:geranylgeranyl diphosphate synthase type I
MNQIIQSRLALIEQAILEFVNSDNSKPEQLREAAYHLVRAGGKRIRSLIVLLTCEAVGGNVDDAIQLSVAAEFFQTASLIHDDIIDKDEVRRGVTTVHTQFGLDLAILASDYLIFKALTIISGYGDAELLSIISESGLAITDGEAVELLVFPENLTQNTQEDYLAMAGGKTGAFLEGAARSGAIIGKANDDQLHALSRYGELIGLAFQIRDDILDITQFHQTKDIKNSDLHLKRANLPLILAFAQCSDHDKSHYLQAIEDKDYNTLQTLLEETKALEKAQSIARSFVEQAITSLTSVKLENRDLLEQLAEFVLIRAS